MSKAESAPSSSIFEPLKKIAEWISHPNKKRVYFFREGSDYDKALLGTKGANLCEMFRMGLPVPPGFVITTESCLEFYHEGRDSPNKFLIEEYTKAVHELEKQTGRKFGGIDPDKWDEVSCEGKSEAIQGVYHQNLFPLLLAIRPGPAHTVPGLVDTILNLGLNEEIVRQMIRATKNPRFALDTYRRFQMMFGELILGLPKERFQQVVDGVCVRKNIQENQLSISDLQEIIDSFKSFCDIPSDPWIQLQMAITSIFDNWFNPRAVAYRDLHNLPMNAGTALTIQSMVYGNFSRSSGTGVVFTRNPDSGIHLLWGEFLSNSEGEDVTAGKTTTLHMNQFQELLPEVHQRLFSVTQQLERHFKDMQSVEFTVENGKLYILESKNAQRSPRAACKIAVDMVAEGMLTERDALLRINPKQMDFFLYSMVDPANYTVGGDPSIELIKQVLGKGLPGSAGAAVGSIVFTLEEAESYRSRGMSSILCKHESTDNDLPILESVQGVLSTRGSLSGHSAVVMRGMGKPAVVGISEMEVDSKNGTVSFPDGKVLTRGETVTICGSSGMIFLGNVSTVPAGTDPSFLTVLQWATKYKRMRVLANCNTLQDCRSAVELGCDGVGLLKTDSMLTESNRFDSLLCLLLTSNEAEREGFFETLLVSHRNDFLEAFHLLPGKEITISLFNAPIGDFILNYQNEENLSRLSQLLKISTSDCQLKLESLMQSCAMFGFRGPRLAIVCPDILLMQTRAIMNAATCIVNEGGSITVKIAIPFVCSDHELYNLVPLVHNAAKLESEKLGLFVTYRIGVLMELPRSCVRAGTIASVENVQFVTLDTSSLTKYMYGLSPEDCGPFLDTYLKKHVFVANPFETIDKNGVGAMLNTAISQIRRQKQNFQINVCGEHSCDSDSVHYFDDLSVNSVSCSPFGIPSAKIASAQATIEAFQREEAEWMDTPYLF